MKVEPRKPVKTPVTTAVSTRSSMYVVTLVRVAVDGDGVDELTCGSGSGSGSASGSGLGSGSGWGVRVEVRVRVSVDELTVEERDGRVARRGHLVRVRVRVRVRVGVRVSVGVKVRG